MNTRLREIIAYKTGGRQNEFCALLGWKSPYLSKLLRGEDFGITPIMSILSAFPEIDARWFLFGTGSMLGEGKIASVRREMLESMSAILDLERFMPVMTPEELHEFEQIITTGRKPNFSPDVVSEWEHRLLDKEKKTAAIFAAANEKSKICRQKKAK